MDGKGKNAEGLTLYTTGRNHIDQAWRDGASHLMRCGEDNASECTASQFKNRLARGELALLAIRGPRVTSAWIAVEFIQLPNMRVMDIYAVYDPELALDKSFDLLLAYAKDGGASAIQGVCNEAGMSSWRKRFGFKEAYRMARVSI